MDTSRRDAVLSVAREISVAHHGGTLATIHAEDGTPYVAFVVCHLRMNGEVLFGSNPAASHARNIAATREASLLIDNRDVIGKDWTSFVRIVIEGEAASVPEEAPEHAALMAELRDFAPMAAYFSERGQLYRIRPRRVVVMQGMGSARDVIDFESDGE